ncbi:hypothetical protein V5O48_014938 [Marasmius crinis-equi]|uniref:Uncharacterized protein n=1 Tax=Marasmius crinis-equi TaxID=585013 RepID=A0ABR3EVW5_9AGAR
MPTLPIASAGITTASVQLPPPIVSAQPVQSQPAVGRTQHLPSQQLPPAGGSMQVHTQPPPNHTPHHPPSTGAMQILLTPDQQESIARLQQVHMTQIAQLQQQISVILPEQQAQILEPIRQANSAQLQQLVMSFLTPPSQAQVPPGGYRQ